ncbi:MAG: 4-(cytidine 5'-diphospho)-2-C-methyl-D-erythritol kinase [Actinomycetota bacterium]|nr:4-(cytidine 5'-diphospho)-2-C-methyl-D-erythritol kinase [Actinomycetota bacterium]
MSVSEVVLAPAKLTLNLRVTGVRPDGYHNLESEMVTLDLVDTLTFLPGDGLEVVADGGGMAVPAGDDNLVRRALAVVGSSAWVRLDKRIPAGGGLGGGSADAAAVLRWAGVEDRSLAARLGADVAFCLVGGRARVTGIGEVVEPLDFAAVDGRVFTLVTPPFGVSTVAAYRAWDDLGQPSAPQGGNDLEEAAVTVEPRLARWRDELGQTTGQRARLAGSGSTWFVEGDFPGPGRVVTRAWRP